MWKRIVLVLCILLVLSGCQGESLDNEGVYYQKIDVREVGQNYNPLALYAYQLLCCNDQMYTSALHYQASDKECLNSDIILGDEIGIVYGNHCLFWSTDKEKLLESTGEGKIYQINGYDESFRIAVCYETTLPYTDTQTLYNIVVFEHLNDITLKKGSELYEDRFHLPEAVTVRGEMKDEGVLCELSTEEETIKEFLNAMNKGIFLNKHDEEYPSLDSYQGYPLSFYDSMGLIISIMVYEEGYVSMEQRLRDAFVLKMDEKQCKNIIEKMY